MSIQDIEASARSMYQQLGELYAAAFSLRKLQAEEQYNCDIRKRLAQAYCAEFDRQMCYGQGHASRVFRAVLLSGGYEVDWENVSLGIWDSYQSVRDCLLQRYQFDWEQRAYMGFDR